MTGNWAISIKKEMMVSIPAYSGLKASPGAS